VLAFTWEERGQAVAVGRVRLGEAVEAGGRRVEFRSLARWIDLIVARDPGAPWFAVGAVLASLGLALRLGRPDQAWMARLEPAGTGTRVDLTVSARYFPALVEVRADRLVDRLAKG
jgi:cytochrome c biogenesis protein ResB